MIKIIWSILNISIFLFFINILFGFIFRGKKIFEGKFKVISIIVLIVGVAQIIIASNSKEKTNRFTITNDYNINNTSNIKSVLLDSNLSFNTNLLISYSEKNNELVPIECNSYLTGFVSGFEWEFTSIQTEKHKKNEKTDFKVNGILRWNLFGIKIYNQEKSYIGFIE